MVEFFDLDALVAYTLALRSAVTVARAGFFLDQHREPLMVEGRHLRALRKRAPKAPRYLSGKRDSGKLVAGWNLVVPAYVLDRGWAE